jgi:hypothetical protein
MSDLNTSLHAMQFEQLLLAFAFLISYPLTLSAFAGTFGRRCAAGAALLAATGFVATTTPWLHGVMLIVFTVVGFGFFIAAVWSMSAILGVLRIDAIRTQSASDEVEQHHLVEKRVVQVQPIDIQPVASTRRVRVRSAWPLAAKPRRPRTAFTKRVLHSTNAHAVSKRV